MASTGPVKDWTVNDVAAFLDSLSLKTIIPEFEKNGVDGSDLLQLTDEDYTGELGCSNLQVCREPHNSHCRRWQPRSHITHSHANTNTHTHTR